MYKLTFLIAHGSDATLDFERDFWFLSFSPLILLDSHYHFINVINININPLFRLGAIHPCRAGSRWFPRDQLASSSSRRWIHRFTKFFQSRCSRTWYILSQSGFRARDIRQNQLGPTPKWLGERPLPWKRSFSKIDSWARDERRADLG